MGIANAGRTRRNGGALSPDSEAPPGGDSSTFLDEETRARVELVCGFVNAEIARWRNQVIGVAVVCFAGLMLLFALAGIVDALIVVVIAIGFLAFWVVRARRELALSYANLATKRLIAAVNKGLTYKATSSLMQDQFDSLDLVPKSGKGWRSRHEIAGRLGETTFALQEVSSPGVERDAPGFDGVVVRVTIPIPVHGHTVILPEGGDGAGGTAHASARRDLVLVKHPEFERMFNAYSSDGASANQMLSSGLVDLIVGAARSIAPDIRMTFVKRSVFVAIPRAKLLPTVSLVSAPLTPEDAAGQIVRFLAFAASLAKAL